MARGMIGTKGPSGWLKGEHLNPKALPTQLGPQLGPLAKFTTMWMVRTRLQTMLPQRLSEPIIWELRLRH